MRKSTLLWLTLAAVASTVLFHTSQKVNDGRAQLAQINRDTRQEEESLRVLQAEWSYLNQPERLEKLARQYLPDLEPQKGRQFMALSELKDRMVEPAPADEPAVAADTAPVGIAADEAPRGGDAAAMPVAAVQDDVMPVAEETAPPVQADTPPVAARPESTFANEYRAAGPRKAEEAPVTDTPAGTTETVAEETSVVPAPPVAEVAPKPVPEKTAPKKVAPKPAAVKPATPKPAETKQPVAKPATPKPSAPASKPRAFDDVIKGLGVQ